MARSRQGAVGFFFFALVLCGSGAAAVAQQMPAAEEPVVVPPQLRVDRGAAYPEQALRERVAAPTEVVLVLEVDAKGTVRSATVLEPGGHGFDDAATSAARDLVFAPATSVGSPVDARIRFRYVFTPPPPRLVGRVARQVSDTPIAQARVTVRDAGNAEHTTSTGADGSWSMEGLSPGHAHITVTFAGKQPSEADEDLWPGQETRVVVRLASVEESPAARANGGVDEVTVTASHPSREVTRRTIGRDEIQHSAGTYGDALLSLQNLPGVARPPPFSGQLVVRGSAPQDTNIFVDGTNVPLAYHFGGLSSVVPSELLDRIDFYPGNYGAAYGRGMGGVVDVGLRDPKKDGYHGMAENSVLGLRLLAEGPIADGWTFFASGQRSWLDLILTPLLKAQGAAQTALPRWDDYQLALEKSFGARASFRLLFFGSDDAFDIVNPIANGSDPTLAGSLSYRTSFWRLQARFDSHLSERLRLRVTAAYGEDSLDLSLSSNLVQATLHPLSGRAELSAKLLPEVTANAGLDVLYEPYDVALQLPAPLRAGAPSPGPGQPPIQSTNSSTLFMPAAYAELELTPWRGARVVPGIRADYDDATRRWDVAPRLSFRQDFTRGFPRTTFKGGIGVYDQPPAPLDTDPRFGQAGLRSNRSVQVDAGMEQDISRAVDVSTDVFYKRMEDLVVPGAGNAGTGFAYGVEWLLRYKPDAHFFGWVSYTLSRSERRDLPSEPSSLFQFDQTHVLTILGSYKFGRGWQLGARFRLTSGDLYTPMSTGALDATSGTALGVADVPAFGARLPALPPARPQAREGVHAPVAQAHGVRRPRERLLRE